MDRKDWTVWLSYGVGGLSLAYLVKEAPPKITLLYALLLVGSVGLVLNLLVELVIGLKDRRK